MLASVSLNSRANAPECLFIEEFEKVQEPVKLISLMEVQSGLPESLLTLPKSIAMTA